MMSPTPSPWDLLARMASEYYQRPISQDDIRPIHQGASGRNIARVSTGTQQCIGIYWTYDRADNKAFLPMARLLKQNGVNVPAILAEYEDRQCGMALVEDLGDQSILSFRDSSWEVKKDFYQGAIEQVIKLHDIDISSPESLQPAFDEQLYLWEQQYFSDFFITGYLQKDSNGFVEHPACKDMRRILSSMPMSPIHRDFQSQNIHIYRDKIWLIDFQGVRMGLPEYDLASLVHDPYARLSADEKQQLIALWQTISGKPLDEDTFRMCSLQRIMQALGAYGKLVASGNEWYRQHIDVALESLFDTAKNSPLAEPLSNIVEYRP